jgi:hypothetical protein
MRNRLYYPLFLAGMLLTSCSSAPEQKTQPPTATKQEAYPLATGKVPLDKKLQRIINDYAVARNDPGRLFCLELEKASYDTLQMSLYSGSGYIPSIDFCGPSFYAEFDDKIVLISTGVESIVDCPSCSDAFYKIVTKKLLGKALTRAEYVQLDTGYPSDHPLTWRIIHSGIRSGQDLYTVVDTLALPTKHQAPPPLTAAPQALKRH